MQICRCPRARIASASSLSGGTGRRGRRDRRGRCLPPWDRLRPSGALRPRASVHRTGRPHWIWRKLPHGRRYMKGT
ncbi:MAG: hypothetical protein F4X94_08210 [Dehalococcoidia bacterium]|nr:hypothetical protein [Dehalococcoidia bacterium]